MERIPFEQLPEKKKQQLLTLRSQGSTLKGLNGESDAKMFFARKKPKTIRQWNSQKYYAMLRIDSA
ncbi:MAG: hypothetical protein AAB649_01010, partial [Patescibacteria group bacterium]